MSWLTQYTTKIDRVKWVYSILAATVGGAAGGVTLYLAEPNIIEMLSAGKFAFVVAVQMIIGLVLKLQQSPLPKLTIPADEK